MLEFLQPNWFFMALPVGLMLLWLHRSRQSQLPIIQFGAMRFIQQVLPRKQSSTRLQDRLLLLLRMLMMLCLITAFANPIWHRSKTGQQAACVGFVLDFTASMYRRTTHQNQYPQTLVDQAQIQVNRLLQGLPVDVPVMLYVMTGQLYPITPEPSVNRIQLRYEMMHTFGNIFTSGSLTQLTAMKHWQDITEVHVFTDTQASHFPNVDDWEKQLAGKTCIIHDVSGTALPNMAITNIHWQDQSTPQTRQGQLHLTIQSDSPQLLHRELVIKHNDTTLQKQTIQVSTDKPLSLTYPLMLPAGKLAIGAELLEPDALAWDDSRYVILKPWALPDVHAMDTSEFAQQMVTLFGAWGMDVSQPSISKQSLIFAGKLTPQTSADLDNALKQGATVVWLLGDDMQAKQFNQWAASRSLGITTSPWLTLTDKPFQPWQWLRDDPWLDVYAGSYNATLNQIASSSYLPLVGDFSTWQVLATSADHPVIASRPIGRGQLLFLAIEHEHMQRMLREPDTAALLLHLGTQALEANREPLTQKAIQVGDDWQPQNQTDTTSLTYPYHAGMFKPIEDPKATSITLTVPGLYALVENTSQAFVDAAFVAMNDSEMSLEKIDPKQYTINNTAEKTLATQQQTRLWPWLIVIALLLSMVDAIY
ncbi:MAG: BatA domain-containing protein, partial [Phycisphaeraceae bacterium JB051]